MLQHINSVQNESTYTMDPKIHDVWTKSNECTGMYTGINTKT